MAFPGLLPQQDEDDPLAMPNVAPEVTRDTTDAPGGGSTPAPGLALQVVQPPEEVKRFEHTGEQKTTTEKVVHPEIEKAEAKIDDAIAARERAAIKEQEAKTRISEVEQKAAQEKVDRMRLAQLEKEQLERKHEDAVRAAVAEQEKRRADLSIAEAGKKRGYWDDRSAGERVLKAFAVGLSTYAHVRGGGQGPGPAYQVLQDEIARDRQAKLDKLDAAEKAYARSGQVVAGIDDAFAKRRQRIDDEASANMNWAEAGWGAIAKGIGTEQAKAAFEQARADLAIKRQQDREQLYKDKDTEIRTAGERSDFSKTVNVNKGPGNKPLTPDEIRERKNAEQAVRKAEDLGDFVSSNPDAWKEYQEIYNNQAHLDTVGSAPFIGGLAKGGLQEATRFLPGVRTYRTTVDEAISDIKDPKLREAVTRIHTGIERQVTDTAKLSSKNPSDTELAAARAQLGIQSRSAKELGAALKTKAADVRDTLTALGGVPGAKPPEPAKPAAPKEKILDPRVRTIEEIIQEEKKAAPRKKKPTSKERGQKILGWMKEHPGASREEVVAALREMEAEYAAG